MLPCVGRGGEVVACDDAAVAARLRENARGRVARDLFIDALRNGIDLRKK
jgi:hypothetical protein